MNKVFVALALLVILLTSSCQVIIGAPDHVASEPVSHLEAAGRWSYSKFPGLEETGFDYDQEDGLFDAVTVNEANIAGKDYLLLGFDPNRGPGRNSRIFIFDVTSPLSPELVSSIAHPDEDRKSYLVRSVAVQDGILYAGLFGDKGLWMVDLSDPTHPKDLGIFPVKMNKDIIVSGNYAYASGQMFNGVSICDISDTENVQAVAMQDIATRECRLAISGNILFVGIDNTLTLYDVSIPSVPKKVGSIELKVTGDLTTDLPVPEPGKVHWTNWAHINDIQAYGNYVYAAFGAGQVRVVDVSNPSSPKEISQADTGGFTIALTFKDDILYVTKSDAVSQKLQLTIIDISRPEKPEVIASMVTNSLFGFGGATLGYMWVRPQVFGDYIYVASINYFDIFEKQEE